jgi:hypothetical protein
MSSRSSQGTATVSSSMDRRTRGLPCVGSTAIPGIMTPAESALRGYERGPLNGSSQNLHSVARAFPKGPRGGKRRSSAVNLLLDEQDVATPLRPSVVQPCCTTCDWVPNSPL